MDQDSFTATKTTTMNRTFSRDSFIEFVSIIWMRGAHGTALFDEARVNLQGVIM